MQIGRLLAEALFACWRFVGGILSAIKFSAGKRFWNVFPLNEFFLSQ
jgi:hypothetical protein